jgi:hypothetical protein
MHLGKQVELQNCSARGVNVTVLSSPCHQAIINSEGNAKQVGNADRESYDGRIGNSHAADRFPRSACQIALSSS